MSILFLNAAASMIVRNLKENILTKNAFRVQSSLSGLKFKPANRIESRLAIANLSRSQKDDFIKHALYEQVFVEATFASSDCSLRLASEKLQSVGGSLSELRSPVESANTVQAFTSESALSKHLSKNRHLNKEGFERVALINLISNMNDNSWLCINPGQGYEVLVDPHNIKRALRREAL
ncbi:MAG: hypothetical protein EOP04_02060 [Proteobacteria bacterium]|nr:MAG: hypothetical protein EOP04_02060 [Pseudomonadota bacterium]